MRAYARNFALVHNDNSVRVLNRGNALGDYYFCCLRRVFGKRGAYLRVRMGVDRRRGIVENDYSGLFKQRAGNAKPLLLSARNVYAALTQIVAVAVGERVYKLLRARLTRGKPKLFVGGVLVAPAQIFRNRAGKQHVFLQNHCNLVTKSIHIVIFYVLSADLYRTACCVVQSWNKRHKRGFARARRADNAYCFAFGYM